MHCRQCHEAIPGDWIEWRQRHVISLNDHGELITVEAVVLCAPPRVCSQEYAEATTERASKIAHREAAAGDPF